MTVVFVIGVIAIDTGFWLSERRGAQKDADFSALAGAQDYLGDLTNTTGAFHDAVAWAIKNGVDPAKIDSVPGADCSSGNSCINVGIGNCRENGTDTSMPWVEARIRHEPLAFFSSIFNVPAPDIGAIARACVGSPRALANLSPFGLQTNMIPPGPDCPSSTGCPLSACMQPDPADPTRTRPIYGAVCILKTGAQGSVNGQRGQLTIGQIDCSQQSANTLVHDFHYGAKALCYLGQQVNTGTGNIIGLLQGLNARLHDEGKCDQLFFKENPGYDDFNEVFSMLGADTGQPIVPSPDNVFSPNECWVTTGVDVPPDTYDGDTHTYIPRVLDLVLINELSPTNQTQGTATITGFAAFYVIGCYDDSVADNTKQQIEQNLNNVGPYLNRCDRPTGKDDILGIFVKSLSPPTVVADPDPNLPLSIVLVK